MKLFERALPFISTGTSPAAKRLFEHLRAMRHALAGRIALAEMDERMFADIGISRTDAVFEIGRRPWDTVPAPARRCR